MKFSELQLNDQVLDALEAMRFDECTPIQEKSIPVILEGRDLIAVAQTGTGKTAAYLLPVLNKLSEGNHPEDAINCIVMSPTRELAQQIDQQMEGFSYFMPVSSVAVYGGNDGVLFEQQKKGLMLGADVVIATPGRLIAHLSLGYVDLSRVSYFILDEADRMLDMGFLPDISRILNLIPKSVQSLMFSATFSPEIKKLASQFLKDPQLVEVARQNATADTITQELYEVKGESKVQALTELLRHHGDDNGPMRQVLVFVNAKLTCRRLTRLLVNAGIPADSIHGDKTQDERLKALENFKNGTTHVLVATDVAARGLDIAELPFVINFDVPFAAEDYVHRIGRTGRAGAKGLAISLASGENDEKLVEAIEKLTKQKFARKPLELTREDRRRSTSDRGQRRGHETHAYRYTPPPAPQDPLFDHPYIEKTCAVPSSQSK